MNEKIVMVSNGYDLIDGRNAYQSDIKSLTLGEPMLDENKKMQIAAQIWKTGKDGDKDKQDDRRARSHFGRSDRLFV